MNQANRFLDLVRIMEGGHLIVDLRRLPIRTRFRLKAKRRERAIVGTAARDPGAEQIGMCEQVGGHEPTVGVTTDRHAIAITYTHFFELIDRSLGARDKL